MTQCRRCGAQIEATRAFCVICGEGVLAGYPLGKPSLSSRPDAKPSLHSMERSFVYSLFDFSFSSFVTSRLIKLLYVVATAAAGVMTLVMIIAGFQRGAGLGLAALLVAPVVFLLIIAYARVGLEILIVVFRIEEHLAGLRRSPSTQ